MSTWTPQDYLIEEFAALHAHGVAPLAWHINCAVTIGPKRFRLRLRAENKASEWYTVSCAIFWRVCGYVFGLRPVHWRLHRLKLKVVKGNRPFSFLVAMFSKQIVNSTNESVESGLFSCLELNVEEPLPTHGAKVVKQADCFHALSQCRRTFANSRGGSSEASGLLSCLESM